MPYAFRPLETLHLRDQPWCASGAGAALGGPSCPVPQRAPRRDLDMPSLPFYVTTEKVKYSKSP